LEYYCINKIVGFRMSPNPLPLLFKSLLHGQNYYFFSEYLNLPTTPETGLTFVDVYAWITFIHVHTCLLSDFIATGNRELLFGSYNTTDLRRGRQERFGAFREAGDI
jgi:hypothetical protein